MAHATTARLTEVRHLPWAEVMTAGVAAGTLGGVLMGLLAMAHSALAGAGFLFPARLVAATFDGPVALVGGVGTVVSGFALHMLTSIALGVVFAAVVDRQNTFGVALVGGTALALTALVVMTFVVVPVVNPTMQPRIGAMPGVWFAQHLAFGLGLASAPFFRRRLALPGPFSRSSAEASPGIRSRAPGSGDGRR